MSWALFIDESGQDQRQSPYEVLAGIAIEDRKLWRLIRDLSDAQEEIFGQRLFEAYGSEAKAQKLLKKKVFTHAAQKPPFPAEERRTLAREILQDGTAVSRERLTALAQAKLAYVGRALDISRKAKAQAFAAFQRFAVVVDQGVEAASCCCVIAVDLLASRAEFIAIPRHQSHSNPITNPQILDIHIR